MLHAQGSLNTWMDPQRTGGEESRNSSSYVSVSTTFSPENKLHPSPCDVVFRTTDGAHFYAHSGLLSAASMNNFGGYLSAESDGGPIAVRENASILNILLHTVYSRSCVHYSPSFGDLTHAIAALTSYGIPVAACVQPRAPLYEHLLSHASTTPFALFRLASFYKLEDLATATSSHLLGIRLEALSEDDVTHIPPLYLQRLYCLHVERGAALGRIIIGPPQLHTAPQCTAVQAALGRAWTLASAFVLFVARPDLEASFLRTKFTSLAERLTCDECRSGTLARIDQVVEDWENVKDTI